MGNGKIILDGGASYVTHCKKQPVVVLEMIRQVWKHGSMLLQLSYIVAYETSFALHRTRCSSLCAQGTRVLIRVSLSAERTKDTSDTNDHAIKHPDSLLSTHSSRLSSCPFQLVLHLSTKLLHNVYSVAKHQL
jgi:hypothetical protein